MKNLHFHGERLRVKFVGRYPITGVPRIDLVSAEDGMPCYTASVNLPDKILADNTNETWVKNYSENKGLYEAMIDQGFILPSYSGIVPIGDGEAVAATINWDLVAEG